MLWQILEVPEPTCGVPVKEILEQHGPQRVAGVQRVYGHVATDGDNNSWDKTELPAMEEHPSLGKLIRGNQSKSNGVTQDTLKNDSPRKKQNDKNDNSVSA